MDRGFGAAGDHDIGFTPLYDMVGVGDGMGAGGAGGDHRVVGAFGAGMDGDNPGRVLMIDEMMKNGETLW